MVLAHNWHVTVQVVGDISAPLLFSLSKENGIQYALWRVQDVKGFGSLNVLCYIQFQRSTTLTMIQRLFPTVVYAQPSYGSWDDSHWSCFGARWIVAGPWSVGIPIEVVCAPFRYLRKEWFFGNTMDDMDSDMDSFFTTDGRPNGIMRRIIQYQASSDTLSD